MSYTKYIKRQDSGWKQQPCNSGETSINLSNEIAEYLSFGLADYGEELFLPLVIYKDDFLLALDFIKSQCPLYRTTSQEYKLYESDSSFLERMKISLEKFFNGNSSTDYCVTLYHRKDGRNYLKGLKQKNFSVRDYLVENSSALVFDDIDGIFQLRILSGVSEL